ncbi:MAG: FmdB family transcriptional regulator [Verrucomicrobia bacterium]|nr:MAG: FmdB family transcriptional regulator [Verrucomicrobiota bacterium]
MPIYEYYCPDNNKIYQFFAKTLEQGKTIPKCPDNPNYRMIKMVSAFSIGGATKKSADDDATPSTDAESGDPGTDPAEDARLEAAFSELEREMESVDENDPKAMGRMMRRMAELTGEKLDGEMEEVVRKLEEGQDPEKIEEQMGEVLGEPGEDGDDDGMGGFGGGMGGIANATRDPNLYDY